MKPLKAWLKFIQGPSNRRRSRRNFYAAINGREFYNTSPWKEAEREAILDAMWSDYENIYESDYPESELLSF